MSEQTDWTQTDYVMADASGRILYGGTIPRHMIDIQVPPDGAAVVFGAGTPETHYVTAGVVTPRPASSVTLDGMRLSNLPVPCTITIDGTAHACTDDHCDLEFAQPGTYTVTVSSFPMLDATFEVTQA